MFCSSACKISHNCAQTCKGTELCVLQSANHTTVIQQIVDNHDRVTVSCFFKVLCNSSWGRFLFCLVSRHSGGGIAAVCGAELIPKCGSEIVLDDVEGESKGRFSKTAKPCESC